MVVSVTVLFSQDWLSRPHFYSALVTFQGSKTGMKVRQIFPEAGNMGRVLPEYLTKWTTEKVRKEGVDVVTASVVKSVSRDDNKVQLKLSNGDEVPGFQQYS